MKKKKAIEKEIFDKEIAMCKRLFKKKGGKCAWGKCNNCGVIPLLYKLYKGQLLEDSVQIAEVKRKLFKKELKN